jgi:hypothetical protein
MRRATEGAATVNSRRKGDSIRRMSTHGGTHGPRCEVILDSVNLSKIAANESRDPPWAVVVSHSLV